MPILDPHGRPYRGTAKSVADSAWEALQKLGIEVDGSGKMTIPPEAIRRIRSERMRRIAVSSVPGAPRFLQRDAGGVGVSKAQDRVRGITLAGLRMLRERSPILQVIHAARLYQVRHLARKWDGGETSVGWQVVHKDFRTPGKQAPEQARPFIKRVEKLFERPAPSYEQNTTRTLMGLLIEDLMTINRPAVEVLHSLFERNRVVQVKAVDGEMIWPTLVWLEKWKAETPHWSGGWDPQKLTEADQLELASQAMKFDLLGYPYAIVRDGLLEGVAGRDRIVVAPIQNRTAITHVGYWPSHVEIAIDLISAFIRAFDFNTHRFTRGMMAEFAIALMGDVHDDDADAFVSSLREATQGVEHAFQPPIIQLPAEGSVTTIPFKDQATDVLNEMWMVILAALTGAVYRMDMSTVNAKPWDSSGPKLSEGNREQEIQLAKEEGLQGDVQHITDEILTPIAQRCHPDLIVVWHYGDTDQKAEADLFDVRTNIDMSPNDVLVGKGRPARGFYLADEDYASRDPDDPDRLRHDQNPWNLPRQGPIQQMAMADQAAKQQQEQMQQQADLMGQQQGPQPTGWEQDQDGHGGPADEDDGYGQPAKRQPFGAPPGAPPQGPTVPKIGPSKPKAQPGADGPPGAGGGRPPPPGGQPMRKGSRRPLTVRVYSVDDWSEL